MYMVEFQVLSWFGRDIDEEGYHVYAFGRTQQGESVSLRCPFSPYFFVSIPDFYTDTHVRMMVRHLPGCMSAKKVERKVFEGFTNQKLFSFARLLFRTQRDMSRAVSRLRNGRVDLGSGPRHWFMYETQLDPLLRFMHVTKVQAAGWLSCQKVNRVLQKETSCSSEFEVRSWVDVHPSDREDIAPCIFASYDIETYSFDGSFPDATNRGCPIIQIALSFWRYGETEPFCKRLLSLKQCGRVAGVLVESFPTERELLDRWAHWFRVHDPDFTITYNGWGFDDHYIFTRMKLNQSTAGMFFGRFCSEPVQMNEKRLSSAAYGDNVYRMFQIPGRTQIDLLQIMKREQKLASYSLNNVSKTFLADKKVDMPYQQMFDLFARGGQDDLAAIGEYCVYDTVLPIRIVQKLSIVPNLIEMSKACWVPIEYLLTRGQQIKVFSQLAFFTRQEGMLIPTQEKKFGSTNEEGEKGYVGATVLAARSGAYLDDIITCLDFASLYPSIMRAHNLCHSTLVMDPSFRNLQGIEYKDFEVQGQTYTFVQNVKGILPKLLEQLAKRRKQAKREMAKAADAGDTFAEQVFNGKQLAFKVSMNSIYGFCGAVNGFFPCMPVASTVTSVGRQMIEDSKNYAETHYPGAQVIYGDSVGESTPLLVRVGTDIEFLSIEQLVRRHGQGPWRKTSHGKMAMEMEPNVCSWTKRGWTTVKRVIRHALIGKRMYRVTTPLGSVDVTEDHSLLKPDGTPVSPKQARLGCKLMHARCPVPMEFRRKEENDMEQVKRMGEKKQYEALDQTIWTGSALRKLSFLEGLQSAKGNTKTHLRIGHALTAAKVFAILRGLGVYVELSDDEKANEWILTVGWCANEPHRPQEAICSMREIQYDGYVYDLTTESHHFQAGIGEIIVHNTDSIFVRFPTDATLEKEEQLKQAFALGEESANQITKIFKDPIELEFEKCYSPLLLFTKKRYCGLMFAAETGPSVPKKVDVKGMSVVRRDSTPFVNGVLKRMIDKIMYDRDVNGAISIVEQETRRLLDQSVPVEDLVLSKTLRSSYKNENLAHLGVVDKLRKRNPGSEPKSGSRVPFVFVETENPEALQFDRAEDPDYVKEHHLAIDAAYYLEHTLVNPVSQILTLFVEDPVKEIFGPYLKELAAKKQMQMAEWKRKRDKIHDIRSFFSPCTNHHNM